MIPVRVSFRYDFIPVPTCSSVRIRLHDTGTNVIPVRVIPVRVHSGSRTGMRFDHILYRYHVNEVRGFVPVRDEWTS